MRNLKKVLSLSLALVMLLGMMIVGAGAAEFTDTADTTKEEAIDVMNAVSVITGDGTGKFNPEGTMDRAQAAIIIARVLLGPDVVAKLGAVDCQFTDVAPYPWATAAVQACANADVIAGYDSTTFGPTDKVNGVQFAKMLLVTLGFDAARYTNNPNWLLNIRQDAIKAGLDENVSITTEDLKREDAAQMAFNAIQYSPSGAKSYRVGSHSFDNAFDAYVYAQNNGGQIEITTAKDSLASTMFGLSKVDASANGRNGYIWLAGTKEITGFIAADNVLYTSTSGATLLWTGVKADPDYKCYLNGKEVPATDAAFNAASPKRGNEVTLVDTDGNGKYNKMLVVEKALQEVAADPVERNGRITIAGLGVTLAKPETLKGWEDLAEGDKVITYTLDDGVTYIEKLNVITGASTGRIGSGNGSTATTEYSYRVGGVYYTVVSHATQKAQAEAALMAAMPFGADVNIYLDADNNVWYAESAVVVPTSYAVLLDIVWVKTVTAGGQNNGYAEAQLLLTDGTKIVRRVDSFNGAVPVLATGVKEDSNTQTLSGASGLYVGAGNTTLATAYAATPAAVSDANTPLEAATYYRVCAAADTANAAKSTMYVGIKDSNEDVSGNDTLENVFYAYSDVPNNPNHITMTKVGLVAKTGAPAADIQQIEPTEAAYTRGQPVIGTGTAAAVNNDTVFLFKNAITKSYTAYQGIVGEKAMTSVAATPSEILAIRKDASSPASFVYVIGTPATVEVPKFVFITSPVYGYDTATRIFTYNAIVDGVVTTVSAQHNNTPAGGFLTPEVAINTVGLYEVKMNGNMITGAVKMTTDLTKAVAFVGTTGHETITKPAANVIMLGSTPLVYDDTTRVFYIDSQGNVTEGLVTKMGKYEDGMAAGIWATAQGTNSDPDASKQSTLDTLYVRLPGAGYEGDLEGETPTSGTPVSGTNVGHVEETLENLIDLLPLAPGLYTFEEMPEFITDAGTDASKLILFRWNNTANAAKASLIEILDSTGTVTWFGWTEECASGPCYNYILIEKPGEAALWTSADNGTWLANGNYTWRVTLADADAPVAQGSFSVKW